MENFKLQYRDLEQRVLNELKNKVNKSDRYSTHVNEKCIKIDIDTFVEISIVDNKLVVINDEGYEGDIFYVTLEQLIEVL